MKVISRKNLPNHLPIYQTVVVYLLLVHLDSPGWVWGATGALAALLWMVSIYLVWNQEGVDVLKEDKKP